MNTLVCLQIWEFENKQIFNVKNIWELLISRCSRNTKRLRKIALGHQPLINFSFVSKFFILIRLFLSVFLFFISFFCMSELVFLFVLSIFCLKFIRTSSKYFDLDAFSRSVLTLLFLKFYFIFLSLLLGWIVGALMQIFVSYTKTMSKHVLTKF